MEAIIKQASKLLENGQLEEYKEFLIDHIKVFPRDVQIKIIAGILESHLIEATKELQIFNSLLEELLKSLKK